MQATGKRSSIRFGSCLTILLVIVGLGALVTFHHTDALASPLVQPAVVPPADEADLIDGIVLAKTLTDADRLYLRDNLQFLHDRLPAWWQYIAEAKPLALSFDQKLAGQGRAAIARCCEAGLYGVITFGHHFGQLTISSDPDSQTVEARRIAFLVTLIHEVTHIRDQRAGRFSARTDRKTCVASETSAFNKQLEFERELVSIQISTDLAAAQVYQLRLAQQIKSETAALRSREFWDAYCGNLFE